MTKRVLATILWFYTGWYLGAEIAYTVGLSPIVGPLVGIAAALFVIYGPSRILFRTQSPSHTSTAVHVPTH